MACLAAGLVAATPAVACAPPAGPAVLALGIAPSGDIALQDGRVIRAAGLLWPASSEKAARERLRGLLEPWIVQARLLVRPLGAADRWGRIPAQVFAVDPDGPPVWLQGLALEGGATALWPDADARDCLVEMKQQERLAVRARLGVWSGVYRRANRIRLRGDRPGSLSARVVYEGQVRSVREGRSIVFVNFAGRRGSVPYLSLTKRSLDEFRKQGLDPATFSGKRLIVRGVLTGTPATRLEIAGPQAVDVLESVIGDGR